MTEHELEALLGEPTAAVVAAMARLPGDIIILGVAGKMGPSLAHLAVEASRQAGIRRRVIGVARFSDPRQHAALAAAGVQLIAGDLLDPAVVAALPDIPNVIYMAGQKFGTVGQEARTWAINAWLPGAVAQRYAGARITVFSTGNVYPFAPITGDGPTEHDPVGPVGEYAQSALARERVFEFFSDRCHTPMAFMRLNYAVEPRYGVLRDIADRVLGGQPVDVTTGYVNVIWQRDANAVALQLLEHCATPPLVLNVTGRPAVAVRWLAEEFGRRFDKAPVITGVEAATALVSDATRCETMFGKPIVGIAEMLDRIAEWVLQGGRSLAKPTHFEERTGQF